MIDGVQRAALAGSEMPGLDVRTYRGPCDPNLVIEIALHLRYPSRRPTPPLIGDWLSYAVGCPDRPTFAGLHGAGLEDIALIERFAAEYGLTVNGINLAGRLVRLTGTVASLNRAFAIELSEYETRSQGRVRAYAGALTVPHRLAPIISAVGGLSTRSAMRRHSALAAQPGGSFLPTQIAQLYSFPIDASGAGRSIALIELFGGIDLDVVHAYFANVLKRPPPNLTVCEIAGGQN